MSRTDNYWTSSTSILYYDGVVGADPHLNATVTIANVWNKADFLNGASGATVAFDSASSLSIDIKSWYTGWWASNDFRFVVNNGGSWYVSADVSAGGTLITGATKEAPVTLTLSGLDTATWYSYTPSGADFGASQVSSAATVTFNDVQSVGFVGIGGASYFRAFQYDKFVANATLVPEPTTICFSILGGLGFLFRRRRS